MLHIGLLTSLDLLDQQDQGFLILYALLDQQGRGVHDHWTIAGVGVEGTGLNNRIRAAPFRDRLSLAGFLGGPVACE